MTAGESVWADWRALIECEINKVSRRRRALQRPLNDLYDEDHQGFDGLLPGGAKVLHAFCCGSPVFSLSLCLSRGLFNLFVNGFYNRPIGLASLAFHPSA